MAHTAYMKAIRSKRPNACALLTCPTDDMWDSIQSCVMGDSSCDSFLEVMVADEGGSD